ncbi:uncharacterized protein LOC112091708 [Morus notabilis]|uniref:uncharacterized protein LOC112091708 n=1 Tax=Morus notabilis TaxID=981085 RepID=UPI000CED0C79|nr:uncharacterized protein LOC112091708 [Morus notabilis]
MTTTFFNKYFPHHKTNNLKRQISNFAQKENETLYQAWERFKDLLNLCPHHGYESWRLVSYFYDGLTIRECQFVEMMCNGDFLQKDPDEAIEYLNELAEKAHTWTGPSATESTGRSRPARVYQLREEDSLKAQVEALTKQIEALKSKDSKGPNMVARTEAHELCLVCGGMGHLAQDCHTLSEMRGVYKEQCNALGVYGKPYTPFSETYNPGWKNHPNFSWRDSNQQAQSSEGQWRSEQQSQPPRTYFAPQNNIQPKGNSLEDTLKAFMDTQNKTNQRVDSMLTQLVEENKEIKSHITKLIEALTVQERGQNIKEVNAISTRSAKNLDTPSTSITTSSNEQSAQEKEEPTKIPVKVPFPQALRPAGKVPKNQSEILEHLTQLKINLPLLHVIKQVPAYAKVIKDLCTIKRKHHIKKTAFLTEQVSAVIEQKTPPKYKDPGCPTISCEIGTHEFGQALLDLGSSMNLMPYSVYSQLGLGEIKPTFVFLQLADRSIKRPRGIVEDVLLQVDKFYYPVDFLVLDTQSVVDMESSIPIILGRPFLATANALINCRNGLMKISFRNMTLEELPTEGEKLKSSTEEAPKVKLARPPKGLKHAFLGDEDTFPVIISSKLDPLQEQRLIDMLKERNSRIKVKMKAAHDKQILRKNFEPNPWVHLYDSRLHLHPGKLRSRWTGMFVVKRIFPNGAVEVKDPTDGRIFKVNGQRLKNYLERVNQVEEIILDDPVYQP